MILVGSSHEKIRAVSNSSNSKNGRGNAASGKAGLGRPTPLRWVKEAFDCVARYERPSSPPGPYGLATQRLPRLQVLVRDDRTP